MYCAGVFRPAVGSTAPYRCYRPTSQLIDLIVKIRHGQEPSSFALTGSEAGARCVDAAEADGGEMFADGTPAGGDGPEKPPGWFRQNPRAPPYGVRLSRERKPGGGRLSRADIRRRFCDGWPINKKNKKNNNNILPRK